MNPSRHLSLRRDQRGVSAVEFALLAPVVLLLLVGLVYVNQALTVHRKVRHISSTVADLIAQQSTISSADLTLTLQGAASLMAPYGTADLDIVASVISFTNGKQEVVWSRAYQTAPETKGAKPAFPVPDDLLLNGVQTVAVRVDYTFQSIFSDLIRPFTGAEGLFMRDHMFERPRISDTIALGP